MTSFRSAYFHLPERKYVALMQWYECALWLAKNFVLSSDDLENENGLLFHSTQKFLYRFGMFGAFQEQED